MAERWVPKLPALLMGPVRVSIKIYYATERPDLDESLILDVLQELKLILARQKRVNARTELYGKQYPDEQAITRTIDSLPPEDKEHAEMLLKELRGLADQQGKLSKVTDDIAKGKNKAN